MVLYLINKFLIFGKARFIIFKMLLVCEYCGNKYRGKHNLTNHISNDHPTSENFFPISCSEIACSFCSLKFSSLQELENHTELKHNIIIEVEDLCLKNENDFVESRQLPSFKSPEFFVIQDVRKHCSCKMTYDISRICNHECSSTCSDVDVSDKVSKYVRITNGLKNEDCYGKRRYELDKPEEYNIIESLISEDFVCETITCSDRETDYDVLKQKCNKIYDKINNNGLNGISKSRKQSIDNRIDKILTVMNKYNFKHKTRK